MGGNGRNRVRRGRYHLTRAAALRFGLIAVIAAAAIWLCVAVGMANLTRSARPATALRFAPFDGGAKARQGEIVFTNAVRRRGSLAEAERLARAAIARDPTLVSAWRSLAMTTELRGSRRRAALLFRFAERLSRRDLATQLWLIEERVQANDIRGALHHYDVALRTSSSSARLLLPVLVSATSEDSIIQPLAELLLTDPPWRNELFAQFIQGVPSPRNLTMLIEMIARRQPLPRPDTLNSVVHRMVEDGQYDFAWRITRLIRRFRGAEMLIRNGSFDAVENSSPFDWRFENGADLAAEPLQVEGAGQGPVLVIRASAGNGGSVARQLLVLGPGRYRIGARSASVPGSSPARLYWNMACAENRNDLLAQSPPLSADDRGALQLDVRVPTDGCRAQWLVLAVRPDSDTQEVAAWVDSVTIRPGDNRSSQRPGA